MAQSRQRNVPGKFDTIIDALSRESLTSARGQQDELHAELKELLELLLREDRERRIESERKRIAKYLAELKRLIRQQRGVKARTEGGP